MKHEMAMTMNVRRFLAAVHELINRPVGVEGMGLLWGEAGEGKTTTITYVANNMDGILIRTNRDWTPQSLLGALMVEVGLEPMRIRAKMVDLIVARLMQHPRVILVDEAQRLSDHMTGSLRDIYDLSGCPVVLVGDERLARRIQAHKWVSDRITEEVRFHGITMDDARVVTDTVCDVQVEDDLLEYLYQKASKSIRRITTGLAAIQRMGKTNKLESVSRKQWNDQKFSFEKNYHGRRH